MKLRRKNGPEPRRRLRGDDEPAQGPAAFSYHARRSEQDTSTGRQPQREVLRARTKRFGKFWLQRFGLLTLLIAVIAAAVNVLSLSTTVRVMPLSDDNSATLLQSSAVYAGAASRDLSKSIWNRNKITIDTSRLSSQLERQFPELASVSVTLPLMAHQPIIYVQPATPALIFVAQNGSYILDSAGKAVITAAAPDSSQLSLPVVTDHSNLPASVGRQVLSSTNVSFIQTVAAQLAAKGVKITGMTLPPDASELDVSLAGEPYYVKFNLESGDATQQAGTFLATQAQLQKQNITPTQYIDVRIDGRAYYQ